MQHGPAAEGDSVDYMHPEAFGARRLAPQVFRGPLARDVGLFGFPSALPMWQRWKFAAGARCKEFEVNLRPDPKLVDTAQRGHPQRAAGTRVRPAKNPGP